MSGVENTSGRDPGLHAVGWMAGGDDYITDMESAGQAQLVASELLPTQGPAAKLEELGFVLGDEVPGDPLFRHVTLPEGWRREGSGHAMWSYILDINGRRRVSIFYKAAFYDRSAHFNVETIRGYVSGLLWEDPMPDPIVDDWTTRELLLETVESTKQRELAKAAERDSYYPEGAASARARAERCDVLLSKLGAS